MAIVANLQSWMFSITSPVQNSITVSCFYFRKLKITGFVLGNLEYMDGVSLRVGIFKKEKWYLMNL